MYGVRVRSHRRKMTQQRDKVRDVVRQRVEYQALLRQGMLGELRFAKATPYTTERRRG